MQESCGRYVERYMPTFDDAWSKVRETDRWQDRVEEEYVDICKLKKIDPDDDDDDDDVRDEALKSVTETARSMYDYVVEVIRGMFNGKETTLVYRSIYVEDVDYFIKDLREKGKSYYRKGWHGVGIYWAWDLDSAVGYWARGLTEVIIEAEASCDDFDFDGTIDAYLRYSEGCMYTTEGDENEIRLKEDRKITAIAVYRDEDPESDKVRSPVRVEMNVPIWT